MQRAGLSGALAISSRWLPVCSMPEQGAVRPATPIEMPVRVSAAARFSIASASASWMPSARSSTASTCDRAMATATGE